MQARNPQNWIKKLGSFVAVLGVSALLYLPTLAQANPRQGRPTQSRPASTPANTRSQSRNIVAIASANTQFKTLTKALQAAGLIETLSGNGPFTVFAPTDRAFAAIAPETLQALLQPENKDLLVKILTYHVVSGKVLSGDLRTGEVTSVEGSPVSVQVDAAKKEVMVNNAKVTQADIQASNGVIHVIDKVILPPELQSTPQ